MKHRVTVRFDAIVYCSPTEDWNKVLRTWWEDREYFRIVLKFELLGMSIFNYNDYGEYFEVEARVAWNIEGLGDPDPMEDVFKTLCSTTCGPCDAVIVGAWDKPITDIEEIVCSP